MNSRFQSLSLRAELLEALEQVGYTDMTPIQAKALPPMLDGQDVVGQAKTGSGKTAAFGLALLNTIAVEKAVPQEVIHVRVTEFLLKDIAHVTRTRRLTST